MFSYFKNRRRNRILAEPFPSGWLAIIDRNVPLFSRLPDKDREELLRHVRIFLAEKHFEGCGGLELTDEMRVTTAAHACLLLLHRDMDYYPRLDSILVYPDAYVVPVEDHTEHGLVTEGEDILDGEAWQTGVVVLSWKDVLLSGKDEFDGRNLVLHEFAHQLDMENGEADGIPDLPLGGKFADWIRVMNEELDRLRSDADRGNPTVLDTYGAEDLAEFFAVATESFFEQPVEMKEYHSELYGLLVEFYRQDPLQYHGN